MGLHLLERIERVLVDEVFDHDTAKESELLAAVRSLILLLFSAFPELFLGVDGVGVPLPWDVRTQRLSGDVHRSRFVFIEDFYGWRGIGWMFGGI